jgi:hypothetical protein
MTTSVQFGKKWSWVSRGLAPRWTGLLIAAFHHSALQPDVMKSSSTILVYRCTRYALLLGTPDTADVFSFFQSCFLLPKSLDPSLVSVHWLDITYATSQTMSIELPVKRITWNIIFLIQRRKSRRCHTKRLVVNFSFCSWLVRSVKCWTDLHISL